jgi:uncharacterized SAM-binding protein YcdF (DUF218 family)
MLVVEDTVAVADAIVVIGGDHKPERLKKAVALYEAGFAPIVIISAGVKVLEGGKLMAEADVMYQQALALGLPPEVIILERQSQSTVENAIYTRQICNQNHYNSVLLVTSAYHSRRAKRIFHEIYGANIALSIQPTSQPFCPPCWAFRADLMDVVLYEYRNWIRYWLARF